MESELFGYERGAFTGAVQSNAGKIELAHGGTLPALKTINLRLEDKRWLVRLFGFFLRQVKSETLLHQTGEKRDVQRSRIACADLYGNSE
ncbi:MAG: hypothetical protein GEU77_08805 [Deltaproteobacteria bacterium]|nr:hypothetical protein [Deltaproteobacteria bacterium]